MPTVKLKWFDMKNLMCLDLLEAASWLLNSAGIWCFKMARGKKLIFNFREGLKISHYQVKKKG